MLFEHDGRDERRLETVRLAAAHYFAEAAQRRPLALAVVTHPREQALHARGGAVRLDDAPLLGRELFPAGYLAHHFTNNKTRGRRQKRGARPGRLISPRLPSRVIVGEGFC